MTSAPASSYADSSDPTNNSTIRQLIASKIKSGALPVPTNQTIFVLYFPASTTITIDGSSKSCQDLTSYHSWATYNGVQYSYDVISECPVAAPLTLLQELTIEASFQVADTATNPFGTNTTAGIGLDGSDPSSVPWFNWGGTYEVAGLCTDYSGLGQDLVVDQGFTVQRIWNAAQAAAGHDPCAPPPATAAYFNAGAEKWLGITTVGGTVTFNADAFSDGPIAGGWSLRGLDLFATSPNEFMTIEIGGSASAIVNNGDQVQVRVTLNKDPGPGGAVGVLVSSTGFANAPTAEHEWPFLIGTTADQIGSVDGIAKF